MARTSSKFRKSVTCINSTAYDSDFATVTEKCPLFGKLPTSGVPRILCESCTSHLDKFRAQEIEADQKKKNVTDFIASIIKGAVDGDICAMYDLRYLNESGDIRGIVSFMISTSMPLWMLIALEEANKDETDEGKAFIKAVNDGICKYAHKVSEFYNDEVRRKTDEQD